MFEKILVCLDGSSLAEQILPFAEAQALRFSSQVTLLQIVHDPAVEIVEAGASYKEAADTEDHVKMALEKASTYLESIANLFKEKGIPVHVVVQKGTRIGKAIVEFSEEHQISLIAIATHGHGGLGRLVFGSVADYVLKTSGRPMLLIRPK